MDASVWLGHGVVLASGFCGWFWQVGKHASRGTGLSIDGPNDRLWRLVVDVNNKRGLKTTEPEGIEGSSMRPGGCGPGGYVMVCPTVLQTACATFRVKVEVIVFDLMPGDRSALSGFGMWKIQQTGDLFK